MRVGALDDVLTLGRKVIHDVSARE
ncbi:hypothetical protein BCAR13_1350036 [Paraburkholderia caribensis]|nr:hypothetical protein BCAR13_1350036 [Paraburkholderia caribensis]